MPDYSRSKIYKLWSLESPDIYIDATTQNLTHRLTDHRRRYKSYLEGENSYNPSYKILRHSTVRIELIKYYPCGSRQELEEEKYRVIRQSKCINRAPSCTRTIQEEPPPPKTPFDGGQPKPNKKGWIFLWSPNYGINEPYEQCEAQGFNKYITEE